ncbi:hypothetical protein IAT38_003958 [Cryptococcus sp. DSM 104549]
MDAAGPSAKKPARKASHKQPIVSCLECRRLKWKCDRQFPCSHCRKRGIAELCPGGRLQPVRGQTAQITQDMTQLRERVAWLEEALLRAERQGFRATGSPAPEREETDNLSSLGHDETEDLFEGDFAQGQLVVGAEPGSSTFVGNGGAHYGLMSERHSPQRGHYPLPELSVIRAGMSDSFPFQSPVTGEGALEILQGCLPDRDHALKWASSYFENGAVLEHTVEQSAFFTNYFERLYPVSGNPPQMNNHDLAVVFLVLANGAAADLELPPGNDTAERFYLLGRSSLALNPSDSIPLIQSIQLMSRYLSNTFKGPRSALQFWSTLGMAIGLHRDGMKWRLDRDEIDMRRRVFWEIYTEDVLQSMTQARPRLINEASIDCDLPSFSLSSNGQERSRRLCKSSQCATPAYTPQYLLVRILAKVNDVQVHVKSYPYRELLKVHNALKQFEKDLPSELVVGGPITADTHPSVQWQRLTLRSLNIEGYMFLHRAQFARALRDAPLEPMASSFRFSYVAELEASRQVLHVLRGALSLHPTLACRFLIFFFHAFTAVVNFAAVAIRSPLSSLAQAAFLQAEEGLALFETIPESCKARNDLPLLRDLVQQARHALSESQKRPQHTATEHDILGVGTKLVRLSPTTSKQVPQPQNPDMGGPSWIATELGTELPTTLSDTLFMASQDDLGLPSQMIPSAADQPNAEAFYPQWLGSGWTEVATDNLAGQTENDAAGVDWHSFLVSMGIFTE